MWLNKVRGRKNNWDKEHNFDLASIKLEKSIPTFGIKNKEQYTFLNLTHCFHSKIDWNYDKYGKLWTYNLNYFDWLQQDDIDVKIRLKTIENYIASLPSLKDGLEPFPISLRLLNWMKFVLNNNIEDRNINNAIINQAYRLEKNIEYHLLGNHLLENFFTLVCFSVFTNDKARYKKYITLLSDQLKEQVLKDGGHFELSPMYHQIMLYRLLDTINFIRASNIEDTNISLDFESIAGRMLSWINNMTFASGDIPLFNDSAYGIAPSTEELNNYASKLKINLINNIQLSDSGYRQLHSSHMELILDVGKIGPDYIPGHAHCDMMSFEIQYQQKPFIVDTGLSTYEAGEDRDRERATSSHNAVEVNGQNQSQVWGGFRVAKRANILILLDTKTEIKASHDGYHSLGIETIRRFRSINNSIIINDIIKGRKVKQACSYIHFHPDVEIKLTGNICHTNLGTISFENEENIKVESYYYAPKFNHKIEAKKLKITFTNSLEIKIT